MNIFQKTWKKKLDRCGRPFSSLPRTASEELCFSSLVLQALQGLWEENALLHLVIQLFYLKWKYCFCSFLLLSPLMIIGI